MYSVGSIVTYLLLMLTDPNLELLAVVIIMAAASSAWVLREHDHQSVHDLPVSRQEGKLI